MAVLGGGCARLLRESIRGLVIIVAVVVVVVVDCSINTLLLLLKYHTLLGGRFFGDVLVEVFPSGIEIEKSK